LLRRGGGFEEINARGFRCVLDVLSVEPGSLIPVDANLVLPFNNPPLRVSARLQLIIGLLYIMAH
jgi:hypothetical protein